LQGVLKGEDTMSLKTKILALLLPSNVIEGLKGKKRLIGIIALLLYVAIYVVPTLFPNLAYIVPIAQKIVDLFTQLGIPLDDTLINAGAGLTVIGLIDWVAKHILSDGLINVLKKLERVAGAHK
jgi:hypothetical protein